MLNGLLFSLCRWCNVGEKWTEHILLEYEAFVPERGATQEQSQKKLKSITNEPLGTSAVDMLNGVLFCAGKYLNECIH